MLDFDEDFDVPTLDELIRQELCKATNLAYGVQEAAEGRPGMRGAALARKRFEEAMTAYERWTDICGCTWDPSPSSARSWIR